MVKDCTGNVFSETTGKWLGTKYVPKITDDYKIKFTNVQGLSQPYTANFGKMGTLDNPEFAASIQGCKVNTTAIVMMIPSASTKYTIPEMA